MSIVFFRNDDIRDKLDSSLIEITKLFIDRGIPITHSVEPANISPDVVEWLINEKSAHPDLIEIMQHGYDHKIKNRLKKGEFGGQRNYNEQYNDIKAGKDLMNKYFGNLWFPAFNFPYAPYNESAIRALDKCNFKVINSHFNRHWTRKIFYFIGHSLNKGLLLNRHVSWNLMNYPNTNLFEIDVNISFIKKYINENTESEMFNIKEMIQVTRSYIKYKVIGVLIHHRYHDNDNKIDLIAEYLEWLTKQSVEFMSLRQILMRFKGIN